MNNWVPQNRRQPAFQKYLDSVAVDYSRHQLGIASSSNGSNAVTNHEAVCHYLKSCGFRPPETEHLDVVAVVSPQTAMQDIEYRDLVLREVTARFCAEYFSLPAESRKDRWDQIWQEAADNPPIRWRLDQLRHGLSLSCEKLAEIDVRKAGTFTDPFVMSPEQSARSGRVFASPLIGERAAIKTAKRELEQGRLLCGEVARLQPACGLTLEQRLTWLQTREKHKLPLNTWLTILALLCVIVGAFGSIYFTIPDRPAGGGNQIPMSAYSPPQAPANSTKKSLSPEATSKLLLEMTPEGRAALLGPEKAREFEAAAKRLQDAKEKLEKAEAKQREAAAKRKSTEVAVPRSLMQKLLDEAKQKAASDSENPSSSSSTSPNESESPSASPPSAMFMKDKDGNLVPVPPEVAEKLQNLLRKNAKAKP